MCDDLDDVDSPLVVRRRPNSGLNCDNSSDSKPPSRPSSDVINQILIDKLKAGLQAHGLSRHLTRGGSGNTHAPVRRTHSDLGGQRLFNWDMRGSYRRMLSTPSPIKIRPNLSPRKSSNNTSTSDIVAAAANVKASRRLACRIAGVGGMRRSISQPLGLNEISSIKTIGNYLFIYRKLLLY